MASILSLDTVAVMVSVSATNTAKTLVDFTFTAAQVAAAHMVRITPDAAVRYRTDGTAPTAALGHLLIASQDNDLPMNPGDLANLKLIRVGSSDVPVTITLFKYVVITE